MRERSKFYRAAGNEAASLGLGGSGKQVIAGHEPCGVIAAVGSGVSETEARVGQRVMNHHYAGCGHCKHCRVGWSQLCEAGITVFGATGDGAHAKYMKVPARTNVPLPDELTLRGGRGGLLRHRHRLRRAQAHRTCRAATPSPCSARGRSASPPPCWGRRWARGSSRWTSRAERLDLAQEFGADAVSNSRETDPVKAIRELTRGEGAETTMDCTGLPEPRVAAVQSAATWGRMCFVGEGGATSSTSAAT